jgi:hypothetical protein
MYFSEILETQGSTKDLGHNEKIERCRYLGISIDSKVQIAGSILVSDE